MSREVCRAVWALVTFCRWRLRRVLAVSRKTHLAGWGARVGLRRKGAGEGESAVSRIVGRVWGYELVVLLMVLRLLLLLRLVRRSFPSRVAKSAAFCGRGTRRVWRISISKAGKTDWASLHVFAGDSIVVWDHERLRDLVGLCGWRGFLRGA